MPYLMISGISWHLITCEYPPQIGGVADYTSLVARELARSGDDVHVWCGTGEGETPPAPGVTVHRELGRFSPRDLLRAGRLLDSFPRGRRLLVQWVPHGYGYHSMNLFFCLWLWLRARLKRDQIEIMFHEVWLSFGISWKANIAAAMHRVMIGMLKRAASTIWIGGGNWRKFLNGARAPIRWLPVPSNIPGGAEPGKVATVRERYCSDKKFLVGQFGIGSSLVRELLQEIVPALVRDRPDVSFLLIGKGSQEFAGQLYQTCPDILHRVFWTGLLPLEDLTSYVNACDLIVQPYPDGISTRRASAMSALANGRPLLTTTGHSTEQFWYSCGQIALIPANDPAALIKRAKQLLDSPKERDQMAVAGRELYQDLFDVSVSAEVLRGTRAPLREQSAINAVSCVKGKMAAPSFPPVRIDNEKSGMSAISRLPFPKN